MTTFLFRDIIFGPVKSRRLGISLGINLLPNDCKLCNFNCIYCECGWTPKGGGVKGFHLKENVSDALEKQLARMQKNNDPLDAITFAGNGEPSMHPDFEDVIAQTILLRNRYYPKARIAVLSNATLISRKSVFNALKRIDDPILKIDSVFNDTVSLLNNPPNNYDIGNTIQLLKNFNGDFVLQTMFVRGIYKGRAFDNTTKKEVDGWLAMLNEIKPRLIMIYTIARATPLTEIEKIKSDELFAIAEKAENMGFKVQVSP